MEFKIGDNVALFGKIEFYQSLRIIHPEFDGDIQEFSVDESAIVNALLHHVALARGYYQHNDEYLN